MTDADTQTAGEAGHEMDDPSMVSSAGFTELEAGEAAGETEYMSAPRHAGAPATGGGSLQLTVMVQPQGYTHSMRIDAFMSVAALRAALSMDLRIPAEHLVVRKDGVVLSPSQTMHDLGFAPGQADAVLQVQIDESQSGDSYTMPSTINVKLHDETGQVVATVPVDIVREGGRKPYLGGYKHKVTGVIYHHASSQTAFRRPQKWDTRPPLFTRETQTVDVVTRSAQTYREQGTQMARPDLYLDVSRDRVLVPKDYFSADALDKLRAEKTQVLQNHWRGYCARKRAWELREARAKRDALTSEEEEKKRSEEEAKHKAEIQRRMHPRSKDDFQILYNELENWRQHETQRIEDSGLPEIDRLEALAQLLHKETKLLQTIDRLKITASKENRELRIKKMLELMSEPKRWQLQGEQVAEVHTPFSTRAKELLELHNGLNLPMLTVDERLDVLLHVKWTVKEFDCLLTREIVDLIDREADLLNRGRSESSLEGLRKRISNLFLQFIETPEFNPEAARFQKAPRDLTTRPLVRPIINERAGVM